MKYTEIGFRGIYHNLWAIPMKETYKQAIKEYPGSDEANCILTYGYIDHEAGVTLEILACGIFDEKGFYFFDTNENDKSMIRIGAVEEDELFFFADESGELKERFNSKIKILDHYIENDDIEKTRTMTFLDTARSPEFPDDVQVLLTQSNLMPENIWVRIIGLGDSYFIGTLLNEPCQNFGFHKNDIMAFGLQELEDGSVICIADLSEPSAESENASEEGDLLKNMVSCFRAAPSEKSFGAVLQALKNSLVWIPCNAIMSEEDQKKILEMVEQEEESVIGSEFTTSDQVRLVPDILQSGDDLFFPVFSSAEEMGEYGSHFSKVEKPFIEAIVLAKNNDQTLKGIVLNAFSDAFVLEAELFSLFEE